MKIKELKKEMKVEMTPEFKKMKENNINKQEQQPFSSLYLSHYNNNSFSSFSITTTLISSTTTSIQLIYL